MKEISIPLWLIQAKSLTPRLKIALGVLLHISVNVHSSFYKVSLGYLSRLMSKKETTIEKYILDLESRNLLQYRIVDTGQYQIYLDINHISKID